MEYQIHRINHLNSGQKNWYEINDCSRGTYNNSQIRFKTSMLNSSLCDYSDAYILVSSTITITEAGADDLAKQLDDRDCVPFTDCASAMRNNQIDHAKDLNIVIPMYNLIEYCNNNSKTLGG